VKILITTGIFEPEAGGPAVYAANIATKLVEAGHEVKVLTYSDKAIFDFDDKYSFPLKRTVRKGKFSNYFRYFLAVLKEIKNYDFVYSLDWLAAGLPVCLASKLSGKKYFLRVGGGYIWEKYLQEGKPPMTLKEFYEKGVYKEYKILYKIINFVFKNAEKIIFNSEEQRALFLKYYSLEEKRVEVIENPLPKKIGNVIRDGVSDEIVFAGRFIVMKNIKLLLKAFSEANLKNKKLVFLGDGPQKGKIEELVKNLKLEEKVVFLPTAKREKMYERIKNARYVVISSWTDISPNQFYECLALNIPVLMTKENYLSTRGQIPFMFDPTSSEDLAKKMKALEDESTYNKFTKDLKDISFRNYWDDVLKNHIFIFEDK
jgi:glycosyltransferase involved in cell wall biosynthesis